MRDKINVLIDCEVIKYPNTGLFSFNILLTKAIEKISDSQGISASYLVKPKSAGLMRDRRISRLKFWDRMFFYRCGIDVYHQTFQLGRYFPKSKPILLTVHDMNFLYEYSGKTREKFLKKFKRNIDRADSIVAISNYVKNDICTHIDIKDKPIDVIYNGCTFYEGIPHDNVTSYQPQKEFLFTIGELCPKKNFKVLPCLLEGNEMELVIAGKKNEWYVDEIMQEAARWNVEDRVKIVGVISEADKNWYYRHCRAFVFPSIAEGFGLPVIESLAYGKPTFVSSHTSLPEIGGEFSYCFDHEFDPQRMQQEFRNGLADFAAKDPSAQINYARGFSWDRAAEAYIKLYKKLSKKF